MKRTSAVRMSRRLLYLPLFLFTLLLCFYSSPVRAIGFLHDCNDYICNSGTSDPNCHNEIHDNEQVNYGSACLNHGPVQSDGSEDTAAQAHCKAGTVDSRGRFMHYVELTCVNGTCDVHGILMCGQNGTGPGGFYQTFTLPTCYNGGANLPAQVTTTWNSASCYEQGPNGHSHMCVCGYTEPMCY